jgi:hypothetical protein
LKLFGRPRLSLLAYTSNGRTDTTRLQWPSQPGTTSPCNVDCSPLGTSERPFAMAGGLSRSSVILWSTVQRLPHRPAAPRCGTDHLQRRVLSPRFALPPCVPDGFQQSLLPFRSRRRSGCTLVINARYGLIFPQALLLLVSHRSRAALNFLHISSRISEEHSGVTRGVATVASSTFTTATMALNRKKCGFSRKILKAAQQPTPVTCTPCGRNLASYGDVLFFRYPPIPFSPPSFKR